MVIAMTSYTPLYSTCYFTTDDKMDASKAQVHKEVREHLDVA